ncbi:MAG: RdgB/HAM1 family non-canonical purine NTP pyrophosphatase [Verrucomicrobia bacterium]|nr:RdgB/HAM1 family non-canonical purine NTP pyrophosphatase [Verrucomicrobiota bacterium]MDA1067571.1 RdgB/HAM1 family non-canonical purine NTP pyrophosphatase [Verrucomicrobiota bacterium]
MSTIYLATNNAHKVEELSAMFERENLPVTVKSAVGIGGMPEVEETESTFVGNATLKVMALADRLGEGEYALADDSGIEVDVLDGAPGIYSARFAGASASDGANLAKLLILISQVPENNRGAQFACSLVLVNAKGERFSFSDICRGRLIPESRGERGFGYDPAFIPEGYDETFGELDWSVKSRISHRAKALQQLVSWLKDNL